MKAPFPYFGGKSAVAAEVWRRFGPVDHYVEPFFGSGAVLLGKPAQTSVRYETVNDLSAMVANFWRACVQAPEEVMRYADWPVNETDLRARSRYLLDLEPSLAARLEGDPDVFDARAAGWWLWGKGARLWGRFPDADKAILNIQFPIGIDAVLKNRRKQGLDPAATLSHLQERLRGTRVTCCDWRRVLRESALFFSGTLRSCAVFLDPPYAAPRTKNLYAHDAPEVAHEVRCWATEHGADPRLRIALCDYAGTHDMPGWAVFRWTAQGGMCGRGSRADDNRFKECVWFSPHCNVTQLVMDFSPGGADEAPPRA